jgi:regulator of ribonuclease activity A
MTTSLTPTTDFSTCDLCDAQKAVYAEGDGAFRVLPPVFHSYGGRSKFCGPVLTVKCFEDNSPVKAALESPGVIETPFGRVGRVLVVDSGGSLRRALIGGNIAAAAAKNGWAGVVIDGAARDKAELAAADVGIRALALLPMPTDRKAPGQTGVPVLIQGVWVRTGDWLYADDDGIVVTPAP